MLQAVNKSASVVLYGQGQFPAILEQLLEGQGFGAVQLVPAEVADRCAATGAGSLFERAQSLKTLA